MVGLKRIPLLDFVNIVMYSFMSGDGSLMGTLFPSPSAAAVSLCLACFRGDHRKKLARATPSAPF